MSAQFLRREENGIIAWGVSRVSRIPPPRRLHSYLRQVVPKAKKQVSTIRRSTFPLLLLALLVPTLFAQDAPQSPIDSDQDGISDALEQTLLTQFAPSFLIARNDCSKTPALFAPGLLKPTAVAEDGTIYGQVTPAESSTTALQLAEIHYFHLWTSDCGPHGHHLDTEHVSVLISASAAQPAPEAWKALYWYAGAHEDTVCDVSQIARASTLDAESHGPKVWISHGKHASYLNETLCNAGCGADKCVDMIPLVPGKVVNLGEPAHPMNGSIFISSIEWPLMAKMSKTDFPPDPIARLNQLPETDIAWFNAGRHPAQGIISNSNATQQALATSGRNTTSALATAATSTDTAISVTENSTGNALQKTVKSTGHGLGTSAKNVGKALHLTKKPQKPR